MHHKNTQFLHFIFEIINISGKIHAAKVKDREGWFAHYIFINQDTVRCTSIAWSQASS